MNLSSKITEKTPITFLGSLVTNTDFWSVALSGVGPCCPTIYLLFHKKSKFKFNESSKVKFLTLTI